MKPQDYAAHLKCIEGKSWTEVYRLVKERYGDMKESRIRSWVRNHPLYRQGKEPEFDLQEAIFNDIQKPTTIQKLMDKYNLSKRMVLATIEDLKEEGYQIEINGDEIRLCKDIVPQENVIEVDWRGDKIIRFGLIGDTHFNSKYVQITYLHDFYDICVREGVKDIYLAGDIDEGEEMRIGHKYECYNQGADEHVEEIVKNYPRRNGITTHFITGNHDHSLIKRAGFDIGYAIAAKRPDMKYLGMSNATVKLTPNCVLELRHPIDGNAYALSYKPQKMIDAMQGGDKPNVLAIGHYHKTEYLFYRNIHTFQVGCFQAQTPYMKGKQVAAMVGGWIVEIHVDDEGTIKRCKGEFIPYYKMIKDDWKNWR